MERIKSVDELNPMRDKAAHKISGEKCRILICGGTGCLASGSQEIFDEMSKLAEEYNK